MTISQEKLISLLSAHEWKDIEFKEAKTKKTFCGIAANMKTSLVTEVM